MDFDEEYDTSPSKILAEINIDSKRKVISSQFFDVFLKSSFGTRRLISCLPIPTKW